MADLIDRQAAIYTFYAFAPGIPWDTLDKIFNEIPSVDAVEVVRCKDCKHWRRQTNYAGAQLSFGFCESDDMWRSLYGETYEVAHIDTDDDFYCGYAERREDG